MPPEAGWRVCKWGVKPAPQMAVTLSRGTAGMQRPEAATMSLPPPGPSIPSMHVAPPENDVHQGHVFHQGHSLQGHSQAFLCCLQAHLFPGSTHKGGPRVVGVCAICHAVLVCVHVCASEGAWCVLVRAHGL